MIAMTYLGSAAVPVVLAVLFSSGSLTSGSFIAIVVLVFFLASAGAGAACLTASELFPMETRALAIAFFFAIGTAVGGINRARAPRYSGRPPTPRCFAATTLVRAGCLSRGCPLSRHR